MDVQVCDRFRLAALEALQPGQRPQLNYHVFGHEELMMKNSFVQISQASRARLAIVLG